MVLQVSDISLGYPQQGQSQPILEKVSFQVEAGKICCLLGASGVGKSSLLRILAGLDRALCGDVALAGSAITAPHNDIGFVFQSPNLLPWLTVRQNVAFGLQLASAGNLSKQAINERVDAALEEVGLQAVANRLPRELSGGMAQRVNLARTLARQPKLILLDEPFSALDPVIREQMQQLLQQIVQHHHTAAVMITHDIDEALNIAHDILLLGAQPDCPATLVGRWQLVSEFPRQNLRQLSEIRLDILQALQRHQTRKQQEQTIEFEI